MEDPKESFVALDIDHVFEAVEKVGLKPTGHFLTLNSFENRVYDLKLEDESHVVTKFYRPGRWSREQISEEHDFLYDLERAEIPVCTPLKLSTGSSIEIERGIYFAVWPRTGGRAPDSLTLDEAAMLGRLLGRIHNVGASKNSAHRINLDVEHYIEEPLAYLNRSNKIPERYSARYNQAAYAIADYYHNIAPEIPVHRIHGDCHKGNLIKGDNGFFFLDFDDFLTGPAVQDIWMLVPERDRYGIELRHALLEGYTQFRDFNPEWFKLTEVLRAMRYVHYSAWVARRWDDPVFPASFPHFGSEEYWEEETRDLEGQLALLQQDSGESVVANEEEPELTNKDFFWDMDE